MKLLVLIVAAVVICGVSAQNYSLLIQSDLNLFFNRSITREDGVVNSISIRLQSKAETSGNILITTWNGLKTVISLVTNVVARRNFILDLEAAFSGTSIVLNSEYSYDWLRNRTRSYFRTARSQYNAHIQDYVNSLYNVSSAVYQCWNASRGEIATVIGKRRIFIALNL